jgi:hypothetical protein
MGVLNTRAICPSCGGKIHTQARGLGHLTWARSGPLVKTGSQCQWCGVKLSGKVGLDNVAIAADDARATKQETKQQARESLDEQLVELLEEGPMTLGELTERLGVSRTQVALAGARLGNRIKARGAGKKRTFTLA